MEALRAEMKRAAREEARSRATTRHGLVDSYDPSNHAVRVALQPDGTLTGWLPLKAIWVGNGWGVFAAPSIGDAVEVDFQEADGGAGSVGYRFYNDQDRPLPVPAGEFWLVHASGASLKLTNDGVAALDTGQGASLRLQGSQITSAGQWQHNGTISVQGGDVVADGKSLKMHAHTLVKAGTDVSGPPQ